MLLNFYNHTSKVAIIAEKMFNYCQNVSQKEQSIFLICNSYHSNENYSYRTVLDLGEALIESTNPENKMQANSTIKLQEDINDRCNKI